MVEITLGLVFLILGICLNSLYGVFTFLLYKKYRYIKKEVTTEVPKSIRYTLFYGCFVALTVILAYTVGFLDDNGRLFSAVAAQIWVVAAIGHLCIGLAIYEFSKSFPQKNVIKYSNSLVRLILIYLTAAVTAGIAAIVTKDVPGILTAITSLISLSVVITIPIIMFKLKKVTKGSVLDEMLKLLIIGYAIHNFFGTLSLLGIGSGSSNFGLVFGFFTSAMALLGFYIIFMASGVIIDFFKGFGKTKDIVEASDG